MRRALAVLLTGCGRIGFGEVVHTSDSQLADMAAGGDVAPLACNGPGILFCDGFEDAGLAAWPTHDNNVARDTTIVHSGSGSLRADSPSTAVSSAVYVQPYPNLTTGELYYRAWIYLPSGPTLSKINLFGTDGASGQGNVVLVDTNELRLYNAPDLSTIPTGMAPPRDTWFCIEVNINIGATGWAFVYLDGTQIGSESGGNTLATGGYTKLGAGALFLGPAQTALTVYIDDVATGTQPIGCN